MPDLDPSDSITSIVAMEAFILFICAAIIFSVLAGRFEALLARRGRNRLLQRTSPVLHLLTRHAYRSLRPSGANRALRYIELFIGFLLVTYVGMLALRLLHRLLAQWL